MTPTTPTRVREATPADLPRLRALQAHLASPWPDLLDLAVDDTPAGGSLVVVAAASVGETAPSAEETAAGETAAAGYALAVPEKPAAEDATADGTRSVYVAELVVAPEHRREGHGTALLDAIADRFSGHDQLRLTARADDGRALAFYRANGFRVLDDLPDHYEDGDGVILARGLDGPAGNAVEV